MLESSLGLILNVSCQKSFHRYGVVLLNFKMLSMNFSSGTKTILPFSLVYGFWIMTAEEDYLLIFVEITFVV
jgi:hypothetical protein